MRLVVIIVVKRGGECGVHSNTSSSCAIARRCCLAIAVSFCWTIRSRLIDSLSCTLILDCGHCGEHSLKENLVDWGEHTTIDDEGAMIRVYRYFSTVYLRSGGGGLIPPAAGYHSSPAPTKAQSYIFLSTGTLPVLKLWFGLWIYNLNESTTISISFHAALILRSHLGDAQSENWR